MAEDYHQEYFARNRVSALLSGSGRTEGIQVPQALPGVAKETASVVRKSQRQSLRFFSEPQT